MKMEVILIRPSTLADPHSSKLSPAWGLLYLADALLAKGYVPRLADDIRPDNIDQVLSMVNSNTLCFGISSMSGEQLLNAHKIAHILREKYGKIPLVWGGAHVTCQPHETLSSPLVDYIVWGEGEVTFPLLLDVLRSGRGERFAAMAGIGYKDYTGIHVGTNSGFTILNHTIRLPYHLVDMEQYCRQLASGERREFSVWTSRGCPHRCTFCSNSSSVWPNTTIRYHTVEHILEDVGTLVHKYKADMISFQDELFVTNEARLCQLFNALNAAGIRVRYKICGRVDGILNLSEDTMQLLKNSNVVRISAGAESGSQRILDYMRKKITVSEIYALDHKLNKYGFSKSYNFMVCTPEESRDDLKQTLRMIADIAQCTDDFVVYPFGTLHKYIPLPGTEMYRDAIRKGFKPPTTLEEAGALGFYDFADNPLKVRPWIRTEDVDFIIRATTLVERLNNYFTGKLPLDRKGIDVTIAEIRECCE
jgi:anaerobic magnesium-protoporphyrin IX monomethyl ester cyclase